MPPWMFPAKSTWVEMECPSRSMVAHPTCPSAFSSARMEIPAVKRALTFCPIVRLEVRRVPPLVSLMANHRVVARDSTMAEMCLLLFQISVLYFFRDLGRCVPTSESLFWQMWKLISCIIIAEFG